MYRKRTKLKCKLHIYCKYTFIMPIGRTIISQKDKINKPNKAFGLLRISSREKRSFPSVCDLDERDYWQNRIKIDDIYITESKK